VLVGAGGDRDGVLHPGGRALAGVAGLVARRDAEGDTGVDGLLHGRVEGLVGAAAQAHVGDGRALVMLGDPVDARDDLLGGAGALVVQDPHRDDLGLLGHAVLGSGDGARHVGAVAVAVVGVVVVVDGVEAGGDAALEVLVADADTGVDDVGGDALTRAVGVVVRVVALGLFLVDPVQAPGRRVLRPLDGVPVVLH